MATALVARRAGWGPDGGQVAGALALLHPLLLVSSSYVEEEHMFWYHAATTTLIAAAATASTYAACEPPAQTAKSAHCAPLRVRARAHSPAQAGRLVLAAAIVRVLRIWHPNGDKWAALPTLRTWIPEALDGMGAPIPWPMLATVASAVAVAVWGARELRPRAATAADRVAVALWSVGVAAAGAVAVLRGSGNGAAVPGVLVAGAYAALAASLAVALRPRGPHQQRHLLPQLLRWALAAAVLVLLRGHTLACAVLWLGVFDLAAGDAAPTRSTAMVLSVLGRASFFSLGNSNR